MLCCAALQSVTLCYARLSYVMSCDDLLCDASLCHVTLYYIMLSCTTLCYTSKSASSGRLALPGPTIGRGGRCAASPAVQKPAPTTRWRSGQKRVPSKPMTNPCHPAQLTEDTGTSNMRSPAKQDVNPRTQ